MNVTYEHCQFPIVLHSHTQTYVNIRKQWLTVFIEYTPIGARTHISAHIRAYTQCITHVYDVVYTIAIKSIVSNNVYYSIP